LSRSARAIGSAIGSAIGDAGDPQADGVKIDGLHPVRSLALEMP
jgi:hypothetical protein